MFTTRVVVLLAALVGVAVARPTVRNVMVSCICLWSLAATPPALSSWSQNVSLFFPSLRLLLFLSHNPELTYIHLFLHASSALQTNSEFTKILKHHKEKTGLPVIVDYYSDGCGPCRQIAPL
jgi:thiol-disulfide isomerase/thioredoxin